MEAITKPRAENSDEHAPPLIVDKSPKHENTPNSGRLRYTVEELLSLRHNYRMALLNTFFFSKHVMESVVELSDNQSMVLDADGHLRTSDVLVNVANSDNVPTFAGMQLPAPIVRGLKSAGFERPSPVQLRGIPVARLGIDVIAQAKSGTGKTLVFSTTVVELALAAAPGRVCAVVLVPTREIARQVGKVVKDVLQGAREISSDDVKAKDDKTTDNAKVKDKKASNVGEVAILVGGNPEQSDVSRLKNATVAVGTPTRVRALITKGIFDPKAAQLLVLDEADKLLDGGAGFEISKVVSLLPSRRQSMAFSATYTPALIGCLRSLMRKPHLVWLGDQGLESEMDMCRSAVLHGVSQWRMDVEKGKDKNQALVRILQARKFNAGIVFVGKRDMAKDVSKRVRKTGLSSKHVTAALNNAQRRDILALFAKGKLKVLVCTDMLSRGVSFDVCDLVIHMDVPREVSTYLHRVGRAGRFGGGGTSVTLVDKTQLNQMTAIEAHIGKLKVWSESVERKSEDKEKEIEGVDIDVCDDKDIPMKENVKEENRETDRESKKLDEEVRDEMEIQQDVAKVRIETMNKSDQEIIEENEKTKKEESLNEMEIDKREDEEENDSFARGFADGYAAARRMIARIEAYRHSRYSGSAQLINSMAGNTE